MEPSRQFSGYTADRSFGVGVDQAFRGAQSTPVPWSRNMGSKTHHAVDQPAVKRAIQEVAEGKQPKLEAVDTRRLWATQPNVTRGGVQHYATNEGGLFRDQHNPGNKYPVVFRDTDTGRETLLSGHHRGFAQHVQGKPLDAVVVEGRPTPRR